MADDLGELSDAERKAILDSRKKAKAEQEKADGDLRVQLFNSDGSGAEVPYSKGKKWLQEKFGIDLDEEPVQDEGGSDDDDEGKGAPVTRFGRRVG